MMAARGNRRDDWILEVVNAIKPDFEDCEAWNEISVLAIGK